MSYRKKLIEVALPLDEINAQSSREKSIRRGYRHPYVVEGDFETARGGTRETVN